MAPPTTPLRPPATPRDPPEDMPASSVGPYKAFAMIAPSRGENKLKAFFRSRSRSRTPHQDSPSDSMSSISHPRRHPHHEPLDNPPPSHPKPSVRPQTRPISSTTTATHSTITPLPSDSMRNRINGGRHAYALQPQTTDSRTFLGDLGQPSDAGGCDTDDHQFPRSETPSTRRKLLLHSLFGIALTRRSPSTPQQSASASLRKGSTSTSASEPATKSCRKRSFRLTSRPASPKSVDNAPSSKSPYSIPVPSSPLPLSASPRRRSFGLGSSQRSTPKSSTTNLPLPHPQSPQSGRSHGRRHSVGSERPPHDSAVALSEESSHRSPHKVGHPLPDGGARNKGKERERRFTDAEGVPLPDTRPSTDFPPQSLPIDPSPLSRNYAHAARHPVSSLLPTVDSASEENEQSSFLASHRLPVIPQIIHTPPTPQRPGDIDSFSRPGISLPIMDSGKIEIGKAKAVTIAHREQVLVSNSQSHADPQQAPLSKGRFTPRFFGGRDMPKTKGSGGQKSSRRIPADGSTHKASCSNITGPVRNMTSHRSKHGSFDFERPMSALNRSSSTMDRQGAHVTRNNSSYSKARLHSLERTMSEDSAQGGKSNSFAHHSELAESMLSQMQPVHTGDTSVVSFSSISVQTMSTGRGIAGNPPAEQSSSWGRVSGRRVLRTSHGTFAFEHPSSVPSSPNPQNFNLPIGSHQNEGLLSGLQPTPPPPAAAFDTEVKHSRGQSYNTPDLVETGYPKPGERKSKGKGRSLDLGLGLAWAPSRVREDVLMPGLILAREKAKLEKGKANGSDVTKMFESVLSEPQFQTFKEYVHRFDGHIIPLEGPSGLLAHVEKLLAESGLSDQDSKKLMSDFASFVEKHHG